MANRYWVGGTGTWDSTSTANWSATSGGAPGASAPTNIDDVFFDSLSGTGTCTTDATATARDVVLNSSTLGLTLGANLTIARTFNLTSGVLDLTGNAGNWTFTCVSFVSSNSNIRSIAFGTGNITLTGNAATILNMGTATNFSHTGTPTVNATYAGAVGTRAFSFTTGTTEANSLNINVTAGTDIVTTPFAFRNLNFTGFAGTLSLNASGSNLIYGNVTLSSGMTLTGGGIVWTFSATSGTQQITTAGQTLNTPITKNGAGTLQLQDNLTMGSTRTFTLTAGTLDLVDKTLTAGIFSSQNSNIRTLAFGTGEINVTNSSGSVWAMNNLANFTYTGTSKVNATYSGSTGTRNIAHGSSATGTEGRAINFNITSGSDTISLNSNFYGKNVNFTGFSGTLLNTTRFIYGDLTISSGMTLDAGTLITSFSGTSGTQQITTNGKTLDFPLTFNGVGGTFAFQDALTQGSTRAFTITNGTVQLKNGVTSTVGSFVANNSSVKFLQSTTPGSQATLSQASGTVNVVDLTIRDINAVGGASWNAYTDFENTDAGNNDGWDFSLSPPYSTAELPVTLRPFTQPRRF
jgi:hypothetical protein